MLSKGLPAGDWSGLCRSGARSRGCSGVSATPGWSRCMAGAHDTAEGGGLTRFKRLFGSTLSLEITGDNVKFKHTDSILDHIAWIYFWLVGTVRLNSAKSVQQTQGIASHPNVLRSTQLPAQKTCSLRRRETHSKSGHAVAWCCFTRKIPSQDISHFEVCLLISIHGQWRATQHAHGICNSCCQGLLESSVLICCKRKAIQAEDTQLEWSCQVSMLVQGWSTENSNG